MIDSLILLLPFIYIAILFEVIILYLRGPLTSSEQGLPPEGKLLSMVVVWLYFAVFESSSRRGTPGKMLVRIVVTDSDGNRVSFIRAASRNLFKLLSFLTLLVGYAMVEFTEKKQALHDTVAGCLVTKKPNEETVA